MLEKNKNFNKSLKPSEKEALERKSDTVTIKRSDIAKEIEQLIEGRRAYEALSIVEKRKLIREREENIVYKRRGNHDTFRSTVLLEKASRDASRDEETKRSASNESIGRGNRGGRGGKGGRGGRGGRGKGRSGNFRHEDDHDQDGMVQMYSGFNNQGSTSNNQFRK